jgi:hypothetical protein
MSYIYEVFEHKQLLMGIWQHTHNVTTTEDPQIRRAGAKIQDHKQLWMGIWQHTHTVTTKEVSPDLGEFTEILGDVRVEMIPLRYY